MTVNLKYLSEVVVEKLRGNIKTNLERYRHGDFLDMADNPDWSLPLKLKADITPLQKLDSSGGGEAEISNSLIVWDVFKKLSPSLAGEGRLWARLTHVECLEYSRNRWVKGDSDESDIKSIQTHFFADSLTRYRDDNALSRLWWNAYISHLASPDNMEQALRQVLKKADIRSNFIERAWVVSRPKIAGAIVRAMISEPWITAQEQNYRDFMKSINKFGGGILFETMNDNEADSFVKKCCERARH